MGRPGPSMSFSRPRCGERGKGAAPAACAPMSEGRNIRARAIRLIRSPHWTAGTKTMCENDDFSEFARRAADVSRRQFGALAVGAGVAMMLPPLANAEELTDADVEIKTADGTADAYFVNPKSG